MTWNGSKLCKHAIQLVAIGLAIFTAMTRIFDYKHHWSDVFSGLSLGAFVACLTVSKKKHFYVQRIHLYFT